MMNRRTDARSAVLFFHVGKEEKKKRKKRKKRKERNDMTHDL